MSLFHREPPYREFWKWFKANRVRLQAEPTDPDSAHLELFDQLKKVDRGLSYEIREEGDEWELAISADGAPELIPAVKALVKKAPKIPGWRVVAFRQPRKRPIEITVFDQVLTAENTYFRVDKMERKKRSVSITVFVRGMNDESFRHMAHCAMMIMESLVGEQALMTRVADIAYEDMPEHPEPDMQPMIELPSVVSSLRKDKEEKPTPAPAESAP